MDIMAVVVTLIIGAIAGWLAGVIVEGGGFGLLVNVLLGIAGAFIAAMLFPRLGLGLTSGRRSSRRYRHVGSWCRGSALDSQSGSTPSVSA